MVGLGWVGLVAEWVGGRVSASVTFVGDAADSFFFFFLQRKMQLFCRFDSGFVPRGVLKK